MWSENYPEVRAAVECIPPDGSQKACPAPSKLVLTEEKSGPGAAAGTKSLSDAGVGTAVVLAIDASGSMSGRPNVAIRRALAGFAGRARPNDQLAIVTFADDVRVEANFATNRSEWPRLLSEVKPRGKFTHIYDALAQSVRMLQTKDAPPVRGIIVITDGKDEGSAIAVKELVRQAKDAQIAIDAIGISRVEPKWLDSLRQLSSDTGGVFRSAKSDQDLERLIELGIGQILSAQIATFRTTVPADGGNHAFTISDPGSSWHQEWRMRLVAAGLPELAPQPAIWRSKLWASGVAVLLSIAILVFVLLRRRAPAQELAPPASPPAVAPPADMPLTPRLPAAESNQAIAVAPKSPAAKREPEPAKRRRDTVMSHRFSEPTGDRPSAWLSQISGGDPLLVYALIRSKTWFGSSADAMIQLPAQDGVLPLHAFLEFEDGTFYLTSELIEARVAVEAEEYSCGRRMVLPGDRVTVGGAKFRMDLSRPVIS